MVEEHIQIARPLPEGTVVARRLRRLIPITSVRPG
jgi:hypothetical protein